MRSLWIYLLLIASISQIVNPIAFSQPSENTTPSYVLQDHSQNTFFPSSSSRNPSYNENQFSRPTDNTETTETAYFPSDHESSPIDIEKDSVNNSMEYVQNVPITVSVIIRSESSYNLTDLIIKEETNQYLKIKNNSARYRVINPAHERFNKINYSLGTPINQLDENTLTIFLPFLRPQTWIAYRYVVVPDRTGFLDADTLINFGNNSYYKSKYVPWGLKINPEEFEVTLNPGEDVEYTGYSIPLHYTIRYLGIIPNQNKFSVKLDDSSDEFNCTNEKTKILIFNSSEDQHFSPVVEYKKMGEHYLPSVIIIDNISYPVKGPQTITIDNYFIRYRDPINLVLQAAAFLVSAAALLIYREFRRIDKSLCDIRNEIRYMRKSNEPIPFVPPRRIKFIRLIRNKFIRFIWFIRRKL